MRACRLPTLWREFSTARLPGPAGALSFAREAPTIRVTYNRLVRRSWSCDKGRRLFCYSGEKHGAVTKLEVNGEPTVNGGWCCRLLLRLLHLPGRGPLRQSDGEDQAIRQGALWRTNCVYSSDAAMPIAKCIGVHFMPVVCIV